MGQGAAISKAPAYGRSLTMRNKDIPAKTRKQIRYVRGDGYRIIGKDGKPVPGTFYSKVGAAMMLMGTFHSHAFDL